jgi:hypothetical protein
MLQHRNEILYLRAQKGVEKRAQCISTRTHPLYTCVHTYICKNTRKQVKKAWEDAYQACKEIMEPALVNEHKLLSDFKSTDYMRPEKPHIK